MKIQPKNIESFVKNPGADVQAVLVYGPDEGLVRERLDLLTKSIVADIHDPFNVGEIAGEILSEKPTLLQDEVKSISMLGGRRVVRLRNCPDKAADIVRAALESLKPGDNLLLVEAGALTPRSPLRLLFEQAGHAAALPCYVDDERDIARVLADALRERGYRLSSDALAYMAANVLGDRAIARSEVEKLSLYMGDKKDIALDDIIACVGGSASLSLDNLVKHIAAGKFAEGDRILGHVMSEGVPAVTILRTLQNHFTRLRLTKARLERGENMEAALAKLRPPLFFKAKSAFEAQVSGWSMAKIEQALTLIMTAEAKCKQTASHPETLCSRAVLSLTQMASRRRA